jgi:benzoyl-CoA reductase/2-hydroxyglutaryl-CoA dehydratase subunit BcrC/BadD/HgdB
MMLGSGQMICDPRSKWYQASQHYMPDVPVYDADIPWIKYEDDIDYREVQDYYVRYIADQLRGLVEFLEKQTGRKMDWDRLSELVDLTDRTHNMVIEAYELRRAIPCPMGTGDAMNTMVPLTFMMGTQEAYDFFRDLRDELQLKIANKEGIIPDEKYRLIWGGGLPAWFALNDFNYFNSKGAVFPVEITYRNIDAVYRLDLPRVSDPIEHLAWRWTNFWTHWHDKARKRPGSHPNVERIIEYIEDYSIDGVVMHEAFSCRSWHPGLIWQLNQLKKIYRDIPSLILESDIVDISSYNEADTRARIDAFIDTLEAARR